MEGGRGIEKCKCGQQRREKGRFEPREVGRNRRINERVTSAGRAGMILLKAYGDCGL